MSATSDTSPSRNPAPADTEYALHATIDGPVDAPVLVLGPSLGTDVHLFDAQVAGLSDRWRTVRFDLPGHGHSPVPHAPRMMPQIAADVLRLIDALGVDSFHYAGISFGGAIGQQLGVDAGDRLLSLTVCASAARFPDPASWVERAATVRAEGTGAMAASRTGTWWTPSFAVGAPLEVERLLGMLRATSDEGYAGCCEAIADFDVRSALSQITVPTLVLAGAEDPATPVELVREIADGIPGAQFLVVADAAHLPSVEQAEQVTSALDDHLRRAQRNAGGRPA